MRDFWKKVLILAAVGFAVGFLVGLFILSFNGIREYQQQHGIGWLTLYLASSGLLGAVNMGATMVYSVERWGLLRTTLTHFTISMASLCAVGFSMGWLILRDAFTRWMLAGCIAAYFIIWLVMYLGCKRQIRKINEALGRWKRAQKDDEI